MKRMKRPLCFLLTFLLCFMTAAPVLAGGYVGDLVQDGKWYNIGLDGPGNGWSVQDILTNHKYVPTLTLNNCKAERLALQRGITIILADGSVNELNLLEGFNTSDESGSVTVKGNGILLIKFDNSVSGINSAVSIDGLALDIEEPLRMIGGPKEGDRNPLTFRNGDAVTDDGEMATYVVFVPRGSEGNIPAFSSVEAEPVPAEAQTPGKPSLPDNPGNIAWNLSADGTLTVSGAGAMENYAYDMPWVERSDEIKKVVIENGVTTVGDGAFAACSNLHSVTLAGSVTGIGDEAFCNSPVRDIAIPDSVTFIGERAFEGAEIASVKLSKNVTYIGERAFAIPTFGPSGDSPGLSDIAVDSGNPSYSSQGGVLFNKDKSALLAFPSAKKEAYAIPQSVKTIGNSAFSYSLSPKITIPSGVTTIGERAFYNAMEITSLAIPGSVSSIGAGFANSCLSLESVVVESGNGNYASRDGVLFDKAMKTLLCYPCNKPGSAYAIPGGVTAIGLNDGDGFEICDNLTALEIPASVTKLVFGGLYCENLKDVYYGGNATQWKALINSDASRAIDELELINSFRMHYGSGLPANLASAVSANPTQFSDVPSGAYYVDAVKWAVAQGVTKGVSESNFAPDDICSRGQVATFLWRAKGCPEPATTENPFTDVDPSSAFYKAILWAAESGITSGTSETTFSPGNPCTRAHVVTFLWRSQGKPDASGAAPLADSFPQGYYTDAVRWADSAGLLNGTGEAFAPSALCPRADIVTYLYRVLT